MYILYTYIIIIQLFPHLVTTKLLQFCLFINNIIKYNTLSAYLVGRHYLLELRQVLVNRNVLFQICVGMLFMIIGGLNINHPPDCPMAIILNDIIVIMVFLISLDNIIISGFGMDHSSQPLKLLNYKMANSTRK